MPGNNLLPKSDLMFQSMFGRKGNELITERLLSLILERKIEGIELDVNKRLITDNLEGKIGRLDVRAKLHNGEDYNIEIQVSEYKYMMKRLLYYWSSLYSKKIPRGTSYDELTPTISILIAGYEIEELRDINEYHTVWNLRERKYKDKIVTPNIELHILEIPKILRNKVDISKDELALWLKFIDNPEKGEILKMAEENEFLKQAMEEYKNLKGDPEFNRLVEAREAFLRDQASFKKAEIEEATKKSKMEIAKKLKELGMEENKIQEATGLTIEEIAKLK